MRNHARMFKIQKPSEGQVNNKKKLNMFDIILSFQLETCFITKSLNLKIFQMKGILFKIRGFSIRFLFINIVRNILTLLFAFLLDLNQIYII